MIPITVNFGEMPKFDQYKTAVSVRSENEKAGRNVTNANYILLLTLRYFELNVHDES